MKSATHKRKGTRVVILILVLVLLVAAGAFTAWYFLIRPPYNDRLEPNAVVGVMPGKTNLQIEEELTRQVQEKEVAFAINSAPVFENGTAEGNLLFENPKSNQKLTRVEILRDDTGELIYKSGLLEPGSYIPEASLSVDLDAGTYSCTAYIYAYKLEDESYIGKVAAGINITVEN